MENEPGSAPAHLTTVVEAGPTQPARRTFSTEYRLQILAEADRCARGELSALLRREKLHSSYLTTWRKQRTAGSLSNGAAPAGLPPEAQAAELARLRRENAALQTRLERADVVITAQKKLLALIDQLIPEVPETK